MTRSAKGKRLIVPEIVQTSAMDCGPASLNCLLEGFGISISYGRLREACQTDVDGTSIDMIEEVAVQLGLEAEQTMIPADHVLLPEARALPAIVVISRPNGSNHFVVAWKRYGFFIQIMDPAIGRRWLTCEEFLRGVYLHIYPVSAVIWRRFAASDEFIGPLQRRLERLCLSAPKQLIETALADPTWYSIASLDATTRMLEAIAGSGGLDRGRSMDSILRMLFDRVRNEKSTKTQIIPATYWSVIETPPTDDRTEFLNLKGVVIVRALGIRSRNPDIAAVDGTKADPPPPLSPELAAALKEAPNRMGRELLRILRVDGLLRPASLLIALLLATGGVIFEAVLFRSLLDIEHELLPGRQRIAALGAILVFVLALLLLELSVTESIQWIGRRVELLLRIAFLEKLPRLGDRYFHSRLSSDMAERSHSLYVLRLLPTFGGQLIRSVFALVLTAAGIAWLDPPSARLAILAAIVGILLPLLAQPFLSESDLRVRTHTAALARFYLDAMLGLVPIRAHNAERAVRREHESLLAEWSRSGLGMQRRAAVIEAVQSFAGFGVAVLFLFNYLGREGRLGNVLLLVYWGLRLPFLAQQVALTAQQYPIYRNITLRLLEPLGAPDENHTAIKEGALISPIAGCGGEQSKGVAIDFEHVSIQASGHTILSEISIKIDPGSQVAIVGPSGAGKSSLVGILLGWHKPSNGRVCVDGVPLDDRHLEQLRRTSVWVDPEVRIWNRPLLDNIRYGLSSNPCLSVGEVIALSQMGNMLKRLPDGLQTRLGEGGALVSGGEGQRVRLGRAMLRAGTRLVILDEPFRGLDRRQRSELLSSCKRLWRDATLLCITHDIGETKSFDRVLVIEGGRIVEHGVPAELMNRAGSRYKALLDAENAIRAGLWASSTWRRMRIEKGQIHDRPTRDTT